LGRLNKTTKNFTWDGRQHSGDNVAQNDDDHVHRGGSNRALPNSMPLQQPDVCVD